MRSLIFLTLGSLTLASLCQAQTLDWTRFDAEGYPSVRHGHAMVYDIARQRTVLFGGQTAKGRSSETWEWNGKTWLLRNTVVSPSSRAYHAMAYDAARQRTVLFGGLTSNGLSRETWEWDGQNWANAQPFQFPSQRQFHAMAYDGLHRCVVMFGGDDGYMGLHQDTWEWNGVNWRRRAPMASPPPRAKHAMAFDSVRDQLVLFGGTDYQTSNPLADTWVWDGLGWVVANPATSPPGMQWHAMAFDPVFQHTVLFGAATWTWDGVTWTRPSPNASPSPRNRFGMVYDKARLGVVLFGGMQDTGGRSDETWEYGTGGRIDAVFTPFEQGCGPAPLVSLAALASTRPILGTNFTMVTTNLPSTTSVALMTAGLSNKAVGGVPLPLSLDPLGMAGCFLYHSLDSAWLFAVANGTGQFGGLIPNLPGLVGSRLYFQSAAGRVASNGGVVLFGNQ